MKKETKEILDLLNGSEILSQNYAGCVGVEGDKVIQNGEVIDTLDTEKKITALLSEAVAQ